MRFILFGRLHHSLVQSLVFLCTASLGANENTIRFLSLSSLLLTQEIQTKSINSNDRLKDLDAFHSTN